MKTEEQKIEIPRNKLLQNLSLSNELHAKAKILKNENLQICEKIVSLATGLQVGTIIKYKGHMRKVSAITASPPIINGLPFFTIRTSYVLADGTWSRAFKRVVKWEDCKILRQPGDECPIEMIKTER